MLRIRLRRTGRKNRPSYRIVVAEHSAPLSGKYVDQLGHFDPRTKDMGIDQERLTKWLGVGAQPSNRVAKILTKAGITHKLIVVTQRAERAPRHPEEAPATAPAAPAETAEAAPTGELSAEPTESTEETAASTEEPTATE